jgi:hypothetical protein
VAGDSELKAMQSALAALQPLNPEARQRVLAWLAAKLGLEVTAANESEKDPDSPGPTGNLGTIKQFLKLKAPNDDMARVTTLAYFLTHGKNLAMYKIEELSKARVDAALSKFNMSRALSNAQHTAGYMTNAGKYGTYQITATGEALVEAMPDAEAVKNVKAQGKKRRRRSTGTKRTTTRKAPGKKA